MSGTPRNPADLGLQYETQQQSWWLSNKSQTNPQNQKKTELYDVTI